MSTSILKSVNHFQSAREKLYLHEVAERYGKVVKRSRALEPLAFADAQLEEASCCYLYGFYRASIVLGAAALETHLKKRLQIAELQGYFGLLEEAWKRGLLGRDRGFVEAGRRVFMSRNAVVHEDAKPTKDDVAEELGLAS